MALLVGSDYTVGIEGIGPVTAIEILAYFSDPSNKPKSEDDIVETLRKFRIWLKNNKNNASKLARKCRNVNLSEGISTINVFTNGRCISVGYNDNFIFQPSRIFR